LLVVVGKQIVSAVTLLPLAAAAAAVIIIKAAPLKMKK